MHKSAKLSANAAAKIVGCFAPTMGEHKNILITRRWVRARVVFAFCCSLVVVLAMADWEPRGGRRRTPCGRVTGIHCGPPFVGVGRNSNTGHKNNIIF